jgi:hypothetical protein
MSNAFGELVMISTEYIAVEPGCCLRNNSLARVKTWNGPATSRIWLPGAATNKTRRAWARGFGLNDRFIPPILGNSAARSHRHDALAAAAPAEL